jgi:MFS family permease
MRVDISAVAHSELRQHWRVLLAATVGVAFGMPTLALFSIGIFAPVFAKEFNWPFASIMGGLFMSSILILLVGPAVGRIIDTKGPRAVSAWSLAGLGLSYMTFALGTGSIVQYYASWFIFSMFGMGATAISFSHAINSRFSRQRGLALGIALSGSGIYAALIKVAGASLMAATDWRLTMAAIGLLPIVIGVPVALWGLPRDGTTHAHGPVSEADVTSAGLNARAAFKNRAFWLIALAFAPIAIANGAPMPNMENILRSLNLQPTQIVQLTSLIGISILVGRVGAGWLIDRIWAPAVAAVLLVLAASGCVLLSSGSTTYVHAALAVCFLCLAAGMEFDLLAFLIAKYIGVRSYGVVYGVLFGVFAIGAGSGPAILGRVFDVTGSYTSGLVACGAALAVSAVPLLLLGRYPKWSDLASNEATPASGSPAARSVATPQP